MKFRNDPTSCNDLIVTLFVSFIVVMLTFYWLYSRADIAMENKQALNEEITALTKSSNNQLGTIQSLKASLAAETKNTQLVNGRLKQIQQKHKDDSQQLHTIIDQLKTKNIKHIKALTTIENEQQKTSSALETTKINLKESHQLTEHQFNEFKQLRRDLAQFQFKAKNRLTEISEWQKEVTKLKKQLANTDIKISELKNRFTVFEMEHDILFNKGQSQLKQKGIRTLAKLAAVLQQYPERQIAIQGHSDNQPLGSALKKKYSTNWQLAAARAASAIQYLQHSKNISPERMILVSYANYRPKQDGQKASDFAANRRIEIILMPKDFDFFRESTN